ncbi:MAG: V-type ATP synthase subunit I [Treponema sp.]|nr:V-type ATP synthase subunit I [Treponema sp.]
MKKVSLVVMDKTRDESLKKLRELGLVHLERKPVASEALSKLLDRKGKIENALGILRPYEGEAKKAGSGQPPSPRGPQPPLRRAGDLARPEDALYSADAVDDFQRPDLAALILDYAEERKSLQDRAAVLSKERSRLEDWGNFNPQDFSFLAEWGIKLSPYKLSAKSFEALSSGARSPNSAGPEIPFLVAGRDKNAVYVLVPDGEIPGETPFALPELSLEELDGRLAQIRDQLGDIEQRLLSLADRRPILEGEGRTLLKQIEFESARLGMESLEDVSPDQRVSWITGYLPQEDLGHLKRAAAEHAWALAADDPGADDPVPTKLKNGKLVSLIYPLTEFLEVTPGYREADISGWFLLFFCVFFGMIFGDAGYGCLLFGIGLVAALKTVKKGIPQAIKMLLLLSVSNILWGVLTCTWFGVDPLKLPALLQNISLPLISGAVSARGPEAKSLVDQNLMIFCFSLALLQLSIGHIIGILRNIKAGSLRFLADLGNTAMLAGMYNVVLFLVVSNELRRIPLLPLSIYLIAGGFALNFAFANYEGSVGASIMESLKNIISVVLGITNVFSDIMSYIRLWAVGLAGASISSTVNTLAGPLLGNFLVFLGIILLVFGHGLNVALNVLSVLVHGVRLNTLEFSSHVGLAWSGTAYKPFADT